MFQIFAKNKSKSASPKKKSPESDSERRQQQGSASPSPSPSPPKKSSLPRSPRQTSRPSKSQTKHRKTPKASRYDQGDTHPLNLPPEERERRRSAYAEREMSDSQDNMDIDHEGPQTSPPPQTPGAFPAPSPNGVDHRDSMEDASPVPPPHRVQPESKPAVDTEAFKAAGNKFFKLRDYPKAIQEYSKAIDAAPENATYLANRSAAYICADRYHEALEDSKRAEEMEPGNAKYQLRLARIYTALGQPVEAVDILNRIQPPVTAKDKAPAVTMQQHVQQAESALREGTTGSMALHALEQAERGLGAGVDKPRKWKLMRGEAYLKMGNVNSLGDAQNVAMALLRINNQDPEALVLRGRALYAQGDNDKALQHFRQALNCDPDFKDAVKYLRMVQRLDKMKEQGNVAFKANRFREAVNVYGQALEIDPNNKGTNSKLLQNRAQASIKV